MIYLKKLVKQDLSRDFVINKEAVSKFFKLDLDDGQEETVTFLFDNKKYISRIKRRVSNDVDKPRDETRTYLKTDVSEFSKVAKEADYLIFEDDNDQSNFFKLKIIEQVSSEYKYWSDILGNNTYVIIDENINDLFPNKGNNENMDMSKSLNTIFYGPAGTGKTYTSVERAVEVIDGSVDGKERSEITARFKALKDAVQISFVTFHQSFSYEEFVEGISVTTNNETKQTEYKIKDGIFKQIANTAKLNPEQKFVLIIDEINRGNVSKIFGELITLLEPSKRLGSSEQLTIKLPYTQEEFGVPNNLYIIGTMNSSDRSLTALDVAMRRRFVFEELLPDSQLFKAVLIDGIEIQPLLEAINERIEYLIGRDYCIGHAYFTPLLDRENQTFEKLADILKNQILPLLQEYFYSDWEKIDLVLGGNSFIQKTELKDKSLRLFQDKSVVPEEVWNIHTAAFNDFDNYIGIYKDIESKDFQS